MGPWPNLEAELPPKAPNHPRNHLFQLFRESELRLETPHRSGLLRPIESFFAQELFPIPKPFIALPLSPAESDTRTPLYSNLL